jgi:hypothetical protein
MQAWFGMIGIIILVLICMFGNGILTRSAPMLKLFGMIGTIIVALICMYGKASHDAYCNPDSAEQARTRVHNGFIKCAYLREQSGW